MEATNREIWRSIDGYALYEVSTHGRVRNAKTERILKPCNNGNGYLRIQLCKNGTKKSYFAHRLTAFEFIDKPLHKLHVDHIDGNPLNNDISNLRYASSAQNSMNSKKQQNTTSIYTGVSFYKSLNKWRAQIQIDGSKKHLGFFENEKDAALAYNKAASHYFGEFAKLNKIED